MFRVGEKVKLKGCGNTVYTIASFNKRKQGNHWKKDTVEFCKRDDKDCNSYDFQEALIKIYQPGQQLEFEWMLT